MECFKDEISLVKNANNKLQIPKSLMPQSCSEMIIRTSLLSLLCPFILEIGLTQQQKIRKLRVIVMLPVQFYL